VSQALRIGLIYLGVSAAWIFLSDLVVWQWTTDPDTVRRIQTWKGLVFVLASAALIVWLVRRAMAQVEQGKERLRALLEQTLAGIYLIRDDRFLYVNRRLAETFGCTPEEMVEEWTVSEVVVPEDRERVLERLREREGGNAVEARYRFAIRRKDGERRRVEVHGKAVIWEGEPAVLGVLLDVTEREQLEHQLRKAQRMEALGHLTGQVAHDFNNFLTAIIAPLDLCMRDLPQGTQVLEEVTEAHETALHAAQLSQKLLTFSKHRPTRPEVVDIDEVLDGMAPLLHRLVGRGRELVLEIDRSGCAVEIDPSDVEQVVMNLVVNAAEAVGSDGQVEVRLGRGRPTLLTDQAEVVVFEVVDDGPGISEELAAHLFEPFFTTKEEGTGLGLSTVFGVVAQAGGRIEVVPSDVGAHFRVELPRAAARPKAVEAGHAPAPSPSGHETVLVVEDEAAVRNTISRALKRFGYRVVVAANGAEALRRAEETPDGIDLVLTDMQLPDGTGLEVARGLEASISDPRVLFMSGYSDDAFTDQLREGSVSDFLAKPFSVDELLNAVRDGLQGGGRAPVEPTSDSTG